MRAKCHGCHSGWDFPDDTSLARCPSCRLLAAAPPARSIVGDTETSEPNDNQILGLTNDVRPSTLSAAWAAFLEWIPFDRFPAAFRQGRLAFDRLNAANESNRILPRWPIAGRCLACDESERIRFRACVLCRGTLRSGEKPGGATHDSGVPRTAHVASLLDEAEAHWQRGEIEQLLAAVDRSYADREADDEVRARLDLLAGHALASQGEYGDAVERWTRAATIRSASAEARFTLAAIAYRRNLAEEALYHASATGAPASETMSLIAGSALSAIGRADEAIERLSALLESKDDRIVVRARWASASTEYTGGNPSGVVMHLRVAISKLTGRRDQLSLVESLPPIDVAKLHSHLIWLTGVTWSSLGNDTLAESWLALGQQLAPTDPSFPRERATILLRTKRTELARQLFDEVQARGDAKGAARGRAVADWLDAGSLAAAPLLASAEALLDPILFYHAGRQFEREGDIRQAVTAYSRAAVLDPLMGRAFASLGVLHARNGEGERAIRALQRARAAGERGAMVLKALATLLLERGRLVEAIPLLEQILTRDPENTVAKRNFAGAKRLLALQYANDEKEEEALECLAEAAAADPESVEAWSQVRAELGFRAASRLAINRPTGWIGATEELLDSAASDAPGDLRIRLRLGVVRLASALTERGGDGHPDGGAIRGAISTLHSVTSTSPSPSLRFSGELHRSIALLASEATSQSDEISARLAKLPSLEPESRLRARWVQSLSLARAGKLLPARVLLEESVRECEELASAGDFLRIVRLQILKLSAAERGAHRIEREVQTLEPGARGAPAQLQWGVVLAGLDRFDEASRFFEAASHDPSLRRDAQVSRAMMQLRRVADLLVSRKESEAHRLLGRLRPSLPQDPEIDHWLNSLEVEGVPVAALRQGDGASALAIWSARALRWRQKDADYWELVRSIAIAAHLEAIRAERKHDVATAEDYWSVAVSRWLELFDADDYWQAYARRAHGLFPGLDPDIISQIRAQLLETHLAGLIREVIAQLRHAGEDLVAIRRYCLIEQIESWQLAKNLADESVRRRLADSLTQRLILASKHGLWDEALEAGAKACSADPGDPARFNDMAELYGAKLQPLLASLRSDGNHAQADSQRWDLTRQVLDLLSLALAWNPHHRELKRVYAQLSIELGYAGLPQSDPRVLTALRLREKLQPGALQRYTATLTGETDESTSIEHTESGSDDVGDSPDSGGQSIDFSEADQVAMKALARKWKEDGLGADAIYWSLLAVFPALSGRKKESIRRMVDAS